MTCEILRSVLGSGIERSVNPAQARFFNAKLSLRTVVNAPERLSLAKTWGLPARHGVENDVRKHHGMDVSILYLSRFLA